MGFARSGGGGHRLRPPPARTETDRQWSNQTMRVLVTGGAGFVGSHACKALSAEGHD
ncbi:MAG: NAD-dependent epimerase/dehydratase family protein, partial [Pseudomonadota bacterium]